MLCLLVHPGIPDIKRHAVSELRRNLAKKWNILKLKKYVKQHVCKFFTKFASG